MDEKPKRGFHWVSKAWYAETALGPERNDIIRIVLYSDDDSTTGEFCIEWETIRSSWTTPRLCVYDDAWAALLEFQDVLRGLAKFDDKDVDAQTIVDLLLACGVEDMTKYQRALSSSGE